MAELVWIKSDDELPGTGDWALVVRDDAGRVPTGARKTFYVREPHSAVEQAQAIENAKAWADLTGVQTIVVKV
jgi:hypothetical protein